MRVDTGRLRVVTAEPVAARAQNPSQALGLADSDEQRAGERAVDDDTTAGSYIRMHRKRQGLSLDQLAAMTKIPRRQLELLEEDRYGELPALVFAKGFLRCCARSLDLDPDAVLGLLYEQEREQLRARRRDATATASAAPKLGAQPKPGARARITRTRSRPGHEPGHKGAQPKLGQAKVARTAEGRGKPRKAAQPRAPKARIKPAPKTPLEAFVARVRESVIDWVARLPMAQIVMWAVVALIVALIVLAAFSLASGQSQGVSTGGL